MHLYLVCAMLFWARTTIHLGVVMLTFVRLSSQQFNANFSSAQCSCVYVLVLTDFAFYNFEIKYSGSPLMIFSINTFYFCTFMRFRSETVKYRPFFIVSKKITEKNEKQTSKSEKLFSQF